MPMDMNDKNSKKKALDLMIVIGDKPGKGKMDKESDDMESKDHSGCKCPCCGEPCAYCSDDEHEEEDYE